MQSSVEKTGRVLFEGGLISEAILKSAEEQHKKKKELRLTQILIALGVSAEAIRQTFATRLKIPEMSLQGRKADPEAVALIPETWVHKYGIIPIERVEDILVLGMVNPFDFEVVKDIKFKTGLSVQVAVISEAELPGMIEICYGSGNRAREVNLDQVLKDIGSEGIELLPQVSEEEQEPEVEVGVESEAPVIRLVDRIIQDAVRGRATDIHIEPTRTSVHVRYRIDGVLRDILDVPKYCQGPLLSRVKVMACMDISDKRRPQDGRSKIKVGRRVVDLRISSLPTMYGEKIVLRLLEQKQSFSSVSDIGFSPQICQAVQKLVDHPQGMILVTGPTGSGKTTTLYSVLGALNNGTTNIVTIEDPVEYQVPGINQVQINVRAGLTFASGLRSILRQDPDIVLVGEMRDHETAEIAFHAAQTGHLVLTTLHTNDAASSITRLLAMGIDPYLISSSVLGYLAQRLVRELCPACKVPVPPDERIVKWLPSAAREARQQFFGPKGCQKCRESGYWGRVPIAELLLPDDAIKDLILKGKSDYEILGAARKAGMKTMFDDAIEKVLQGSTSLSEVVRVIGPPRHPPSEKKRAPRKVPLKMVKGQETSTASS